MEKVSVLLFHHFGFPAPLPFHLNGDLIHSDYDYNAAGVITNKLLQAELAIVAFL
jgi:hypothetical protein